MLYPSSGDDCLRFACPPIKVTDQWEGHHACIFPRRASLGECLIQLGSHCKQIKVSFTKRRVHSIFSNQEEMPKLMQRWYWANDVCFRICLPAMEKSIFFVMVDQEMCIGPNAVLLYNKWNTKYLFSTVGVEPSLPIIKCSLCPRLIFLSFSGLSCYHSLDSRGDLWLLCDFHLCFNLYILLMPKFCIYI